MACYKRLVEKIVKVQGRNCYLCGCEIPHNETITKDHVFPKKLGYSLNSNLMLAHQECNVKKAHRLPTLEEIQLSIDLYDLLGYVFDPHMIGDKSNKMYRERI